jgi:hypothetical protein
VLPDSTITNVLLVLNKTDRPATWDLGSVGDAVHVSALTGVGLSDLCGVLAGRLVPSTPPPGAAVPFTPRLCQLVGEVQRRLAASEVDEARAGLDAMLAG